jgi:hypothetical protein
LSKKSKRKLDKRRQAEEYTLPFESDDDYTSIPVRERMVTVPLLDQNEVNWLIKSSNEPYKGPKQTPKVASAVEHSTYSEHEAAALQEVATPQEPKKNDK